MRTARETYEAVLNELNYHSTKSMTPDEFNYHANIAQLEYMKTRYWAHQQHQKSIDDLRFVMVETDGIGNMPNPLVFTNTSTGSYVTLPDDYLILTKVAIIGEYKNVPCIKDGTISPPTAATTLSDDRDYVISDNTYTSPLLRFPRAYYKQRDNVIVAKIGDSIPLTAIIGYIRKPVRIEVDQLGNSVTDPEFDDMQVSEIVKWTRASFLEQIESMRAQTARQYDVATQFLQFPPPNMPT